jgi:FAD/FMN-containing dehydrogenase
VIPVGGNTGLVGGTLAPTDAGRPMVVLSTERLVGTAVDPSAGTVLAGAGVTIAEVHREASRQGWTFGVDFAARDSATVGGAIATNAGGLRVCAYGTMRRQVAGLEAVLGDGSVVTDLMGLPKDNTGFDLRDLLTGSEGCLAVVTRARLELHRPPGELMSLAVPQPTLRDALAVAAAVGMCGRTMAAEVVDWASWSGAAVDLQLRDPLPGLVAGYALLVDLASVDGDRLAAVLAGQPDAVVAERSGDRHLLWQPREGQTEWWSASARTMRLFVHKFDVSLPLGTLDESVAQLRRLCADWPGVAGFGVFGHLLEGSLHIQVLAPGGNAEHPRRLLAAVAESGGSISAEHGIGRDKAALLPLRRSAAEIDAMRRIKQALDPAGVLNPGAVLR